jgi:hypothetical protein
MAMLCHIGPITLDAERLGRIPDGAFGPAVVRRAPAGTGRARGGTTDPAPPPGT